MHEIEQRPQTARARARTRRNFIIWTLGGLLGAIAATITAPILVYLYPTKTAATTRTPIRIALGTPVDAHRRRWSGPVRRAREQRAHDGRRRRRERAGHYTYGGYFTRVGGHFHALAITCPHLGCS
jgi:Rieske Fe-S protein